MGSRFCTQAEAKYAAIEGELLALTFGLEKSKFWTLGNPHLVVFVNHKPLLGLLKNKDIDSIENPRLNRLLIKTLKWNFDIHHVAGFDNCISDALSRFPSQSAAEIENFVGEFCEMSEMSCLTWDEVIKASQHCPKIKEIKSLIQSGANDRREWSNIPQYFKYRSLMKEKDDVIIYKGRLLIPSSLRPKALKWVHSAHQGFNNMMLRINKIMWWPLITKDVTKLHENCQKCTEDAPSQTKDPPEKLIKARYPFQYICADFFEVRGKQFLIIVDRFSSWPLVYRFTKANSQELTKCMRKVFESYGIPEVLTTDGGDTVHLP